MKIGLFWYFDGLVQDCSNSIANALELLQFCTKPSISSLKSVSWGAINSSLSYLINLAII